MPRATVTRRFSKNKSGDFAIATFALPHITSRWKFSTHNTLVRSRNDLAKNGTYTREGAKRQESPMSTSIVARSVKTSRLPRYICKFRNSKKLRAVQFNEKLLAKPTHGSFKVWSCSPQRHFETVTISSEYRDGCKARFQCILMVVVNQVSSVFWETLGKGWESSQNTLKRLNLLIRKMNFLRLFEYVVYFVDDGNSFLFSPTMISVASFHGTDDEKILLLKRLNNIFHLYYDRRYT